MKQYSFVMDEKTADALTRVSSVLGFSRSGVVRRLIALADGAVFWGLQHHMDERPEQMRKRAVRALDEWGLVTLASDPLDPVAMARVGPPVRKPGKR